MTTTALNTPDRAPLDNSTIRTQLAHRTIRAFTQEPLSDDVVTTLLEVARHTATASFQQQLTVIRVQDPNIRAQIHSASGQPYVGGTAGELFILVADLHRNAWLRESAGADLAPLETTNLFMAAVEDVLLAAQNMVLAAESLGLGTCYLGSIQGDPRLVISALGLPQRTFPVLGLLVGHSAQEPQYKPRLPLAVTTGVDAYPDPAAHAEEIAAYDQVVQQYYDLRDSNQRIDSFSHQIATALGQGRAAQSPMLDVLHEQRLCLR
ncbi:FMN reductase (NADPH) [Actinomyces bovis]|uniref:FMN reductase (NADPH) n=1 Tax=Actinomyces bovis TaxID=1658 RepID=A0ABY1VPC7_9ACTO|nr:NADPH-dependent oxidoreductase [Actinomyces bovis]SPT53572.1 FMN reductase (NADPH) [Actinomyces bovis]VEG55566.1 FMN reductase (NADPH) [Actinomyces israelii]